MHIYPKGAEIKPYGTAVVSIEGGGKEKGQVPKCSTVVGLHTALRSENKWPKSVMHKSYPQTTDTLRSGLPKPAYIEIPIFRLFDVKSLGLYNVLLCTGGKICGGGDETHSPKSAIYFPV